MAAGGGKREKVQGGHVLCSSRNRFQRFMAVIIFRLSTRRSAAVQTGICLRFQGTYSGSARKTKPCSLSGAGDQSGYLIAEIVNKLPIWCEDHKKGLTMASIIEMKVGSGKFWYFCWKWEVVSDTSGTLSGGSGNAD